jgi:hypothetical protein
MAVLMKEEEDVPIPIDDDVDGDDDEVCQAFSHRKHIHEICPVGLDFTVTSRILTRNRNLFVNNFDLFIGE